MVFRESLHADLSHRPNPYPDWTGLAWKRRAAHQTQRGEGGKSKVKKAEIEIKEKAQNGK